MTRTLSARAALAAAALAFVAGGCTRSTDFTITERFDPLVSPGGGVTYTFTSDVDLAAQAGGAWKRRDHVRSLELAGLDVTMIANHTGVATTGSGTVQLSRAGTTVTVATWTNQPIPATAPHSFDVAVNPAATALIDDALHGDGRFTVTASGSTAAPVSLGVEVSLHMHMRYRVP